MPQVLKELMRHESIETTMRFYVGRNAHTTADAVWEAYEAKTGRKGTVLGSPPAKNRKSGFLKNDRSPCGTRASKCSKTRTNNPLIKSQMLCRLS